MENTARTPAKFSDRPFWNKTGLDWVSMTFLLVTPFIAIAGVTVWIVNGWATGWHWLHFVLGFVVSGITVTAGYHRLFSHRSYETGWPLKLFYLLFGAANFQNSALRWASKHRYHHRFVDTDSDPYDINKGFFWAHMGWIFQKDPPEHQYQNTPDLLRDKLVMWQHRHCIKLGILMGFGLPTLIGILYGDPLGGFIFGGFLRVVVMGQSTFLINSAAHAFGSKPHGDDSTARNAWWLALLTWGEGYHNWHHQYASDYRNGARWYHFDPGKWWIAGLSWVGLTKRLSRVRIPTR